MAHPSPSVYEVDLPRGTRVHRHIKVKTLRPAERLDRDKPPPVQVAQCSLVYHDLIALLQLREGAAVLVVIACTSRSCADDGSVLSR